MTRVYDEKRQAGSSYVLSFYNSVQLLTHWYANYVNLLMELKHKYGDQHAEKMVPDEKDVLKKYVQTLRYHVIQAHTSYITIMQGLEQQPNKEIVQLYERVKEQFVPKMLDLEKYVNHLNTVIVNTVVRNLLETSHDIVDQLYGDDSAVQTQ